MQTNKDLGPLRTGQRVLIIGGGPAGVGCAIGLVHSARRLNQQIEIVLFEPKHFGQHYNQCTGILSPPLIDQLKQNYNIVLPSEMIQREIVGYTLYSDDQAIELKATREKEISHAVRRVEFDRFLLDYIESLGVRVIKSRATDIEFHTEDVIVYSESGSHSGDVLVGAFGLDRVMCEAFAKRTGYRAPQYLETVVTKIHPEPYYLEKLKNNIHVFLPTIKVIEFAAIIPKGNHITIITAGKKVNIKSLKSFLRLPQVKKLLDFDYEITACFKGSFPIGLAKNSYGDRYVVIGDAGGLVRPFKGKGINSAVFTGAVAAETIMKYGISKHAFRRFYDECRELTADLWYGRLVRLLANITSNHLSLDPFITVAKKNTLMREELLFDCVSGRQTYRNIVHRGINLKLGSQLMLSLVQHYFTKLLLFKYKHFAIMLILTFFYHIHC